MKVSSTFSLIGRALAVGCVGFGVQGCGDGEVVDGFEEVDSVDRPWTTGTVDNATTSAPIGAALQVSTNIGSCTGTLIEDRSHVLTSKHCFCPRNPDNTYSGAPPDLTGVSVSIVDPQVSGGATYNAASVVVMNDGNVPGNPTCPAANSPSFNHAEDLAVITLQNPVPATAVDSPVFAFVGNHGALLADNKFPASFQTAGYAGTNNRTVVSGTATLTDSPPLDDGDPSIEFTTGTSNTEGGDSGGSLYGFVPGYGAAYAFGANGRNNVPRNDTNYYTPMGSIDPAASTQEDPRSGFIRSALSLPSQVQQIFGGTVALYGAGGVKIDDRTVVDSFTGGGVIVGNQVEIGSEAQTGAINSDNVLLRSNMTTGNVITNTFSVQGPGTVGRFMPYEDIEIQQDPYVIVNPAFQQTGHVVRYDGAPAIELSPGAYGRFDMHSTVTLRSGTYSFNEFNVEPTGIVRFDASAGPIRIAVRDKFVIRGTLRADTINMGDPTGGRLGLADSVLWVYGGTSTAIIERAFTGSLISSAPITVDHDDDPHFGALFSLSTQPAAVTVRPGHTFTHVAFDGDYGFELPPPPDPMPGDFSAIFTDNAEWGTGYCKNIQVTNNAPVESSDWEVEFDLQGTEIYLTWNGIFSGDTGIVTARPAQWWNQRVWGLGSDTTVGFCARRPSGSSADPVMLSATGEY